MFSAKIGLISDVNAGINFGRRLLKDCILDNNEDKDWRYIWRVPGEKLINTFILQ